MSALKKIANSVAALFSEEARARQEVAKAEEAVREAQQLFDGSPSQAAGELVMTRKRELEHAKLFVDRAERLGAEERAKEQAALTAEKREKLAKLQAVADDQAVARDIRALVQAAYPELATLAALDRAVLKRVREAAIALEESERIQAQLEGRPHDRQRVQAHRVGLAAKENFHAVYAAELVKHNNIDGNLRWLATMVKL